MKKLFLLFSISFILLAGIVSAEVPRYGMMGSDGQFVPIAGYNGYGGMMGMMQMMSGYGGYGGYSPIAVILSWIIYLLIIALIISAIYWLINSTNKRR